ncbi:hypothetical protein PUN28_013048 [Cardiocondyla obscurior]|uniref:Uncharacterized protein n=1 Tax=Cardiocondyla obscurior TaxID=286306 RepID=A0AAW2FBQ8_9HYME
MNEARNDKTLRALRRGDDVSLGTMNNRRSTARDTVGDNDNYESAFSLSLSLSLKSDQRKYCYTTRPPPRVEYFRESVASFCKSTDAAEMLIKTNAKYRTVEY